MKDQVFQLNLLEISYTLKSIYTYSSCTQRKITNPRMGPGLHMITTGSVSISCNFLRFALLSEKIWTYSLKKQSCRFPPSWGLFKAGCSSTTHFLSVVKPSEVIPQPWLYFPEFAHSLSQAYSFSFLRPRQRTDLWNKSSPEKGSPILRLKLSYSSDSIDFLVKSKSASCGKDMHKVT